MMTPEQFKRLPKYAQHEIEILRMRVAEATAKVAERNSVERSEPHVMIDPYSMDLSETRPITTRLSFNPNGDCNEFFQVHLNGDALEIYCDSLIRLKPTSGNIITIERRGWDE